MKQKTINQLVGAAIAAYIFVYVILTYFFLVHRAFTRPGDIILGEVAVIANVVLGLLLAVIKASPRFQIIGSGIMLFTYIFYQILALRFTELGQVSVLVTTPAMLLILPLILPLVVGISREVKIKK